jgi:transposase-like protein
VGRRYTEADKQKALAALLASAVERDGETVPNYAQVCTATGVSRKTLMRWWDDHQPQTNAQLCTVVEREREVARADGAAIIHTMLSAIERQVAYIADPSHYDTTIHVDEHGRRQRTGARLDHAARAFEVVLRSHQQVLAIMGEADTTETQTLDTAREAARRTLMLKTLKGGKQ